MPSPDAVKRRCASKVSPPASSSPGEPCVSAHHSSDEINARSSSQTSTRVSRSPASRAPTVGEKEGSGTRGRTARRRDWTRPLTLSTLDLMAENAEFVLFSSTPSAFPSWTTSSWTRSALERPSTCVSVLQSQLSRSAAGFGGLAVSIESPGFPPMFPAPSASFDGPRAAAHRTSVACARPRRAMSRRCCVTIPARCSAYPRAREASLPERSAWQAVLRMRSRRRRFTQR
mmetsp:Transcript_25139/g.60466  ORF Transcript_25139/g.60466 Transcript_25139/m.60466 type:complete len:230 (+) Transcript_25139:1530-2219(+)